MPPMYYTRPDTSGHRGDIGHRPHDEAHFYTARQNGHNSSILSIHPAPPSIDDYGEITLEEEVDHILILVVTLLPLLFAASIIAGVAILIRKMKKDSGSRVRASAEDHSFSSLPTPVLSPWWRDSTLARSRGHSVSLPHLHLSTSTAALSMPHILAIETYYNYPSTTSILDETFQDVVDREKIQAEVALELSSHYGPTSSPKPLKRSLSLKSLRRLRRRILRLFRKRREASQSEATSPNTFSLSPLPLETRQQLKQIYVY